MERGVFEIVDTESLVPANHLLRKIDAAVDFGKIYDMVEPLYCADRGIHILTVFPYRSFPHFSEQTPVLLDAELGFVDTLITHPYSTVISKDPPFHLRAFARPFAKSPWIPWVNALKL